MPPFVNSSKEFIEIFFKPTLASSASAGIKGREGEREKLGGIVRALLIVASDKFSGYVRDGDGTRWIKNNRVLH